MTERRRHAFRERIAFLPDIHIPHHDPKAVETAMSVLRAFKPDTIFQIGDLLDCYAISRFEKDPKRVSSLQDEFDQGRDLLKRLREEHPKARIVIKEGNHEERLQRYLWSRAPELSGLRCLGIAEQLGLADLNIEYFTGKQRLKIGDNFTVTHGSLVRQRAGYTAHGEMFHRGGSGISGHTHRLSQVFRSTDGGVHRWIEAGCLCSLEPEYGADRALDWQQGFVLGQHYIDRDRGIDHLALDLLPLVDGVVQFEGRVYGPDFVYAP